MRYSPNIEAYYMCESNDEHESMRLFHHIEGEGLTLTTEGNNGKVNKKLFLDNT